MRAVNTGWLFHLPEHTIVEVLQPMHNVYSGYYHEDGWWKLGPATVLPGEQYEIENVYGDAIRLLLLPEKQVTIDLRKDMFGDFKLIGENNS